MVTGEIFGELIVAVLVGRDDPAHDARLFELGQVAVRAALGQIGLAGEDLGKRHRTAFVGEHIDDGATRTGIALSDRAEQCRHRVVHILHSGALYRLRRDPDQAGGLGVSIALAPGCMPSSARI